MSVTITRADVAAALRRYGLPARLVTLGGGVLAVDCVSDPRITDQSVIVTLDMGADSTEQSIGSAEISANYPPDVNRPDDAPHREVMAWSADDVARHAIEIGRELGLTTLRLLTPREYVSAAEYLDTYTLSTSGAQAHCPRGLSNATGPELDSLERAARRAGWNPDAPVTVADDDEWARCDVFGHDWNTDDRCEACGMPMASDGAR